ncbi:MAG: lspA [Ilumatobacteraceae bacterium]|nr:lspA [Ilumatobacteraceae bacterium]
MTESDDGSPAVSADAEPEAGTTPDPEPGETVAVVEPKSARRPTLRFSVAIAVVVLVLDQLSKRWALRSLSDGQSRHVIWTWHWNLTFNSGMAFSRAQGVGPYIGAVAFIVIIVMLLSVRRNGGVVSSIAVGLVVGGAVGNLSDRLFREQGWLRGRVIDFIDFRWWPIFNVADMGVTIGGALLLLAALFDSRRAGTGSPR